MLEIHGVKVQQTGADLNTLNLEINAGEIRSILSADVNALDELARTFLAEKHSKTGRIVLDGRYLYKYREKNVLCCITKEESLFYRVSIGENIAVGQKRNYFVRKRSYLKQYGELLKKFDSQISLDKSMEELGSGERRIVELMRAYVCRPRILVIEDMINRGDYKNTDVMLKILEELKNLGVMILYLTNKWEDAICLSDKITVISGGTDVATLTVQEAKQDTSRLYYLMNSSNDMQESIDEMSELFESIQSSMNQMEERKDFYCNMKQIACKISRDLNALNCIIYLFEQKKGWGPSIFIGTREEKSELNEEQKAPIGTHPAGGTAADCGIRFKISPEILRKFADGGKYQIFDVYDANYKCLFTGHEHPRSVLLFPINKKQDCAGIIQVNFDRLFSMEQKEVLYLSVLKKEIFFMLERSRLKEESLLIQESHHRIKNNLQLVTSLLQMQENNLSERMDTDDKGYRMLCDVLDITVGRINSISMIHEFLSKSALINSVVGIPEVLNEFGKLYRGQAVISYEMDDLYISHELAPSMSLLLNELITNSIKHSQKECPHVHIGIYREQKGFKIKYRDDGVGFPENFDIKTQNSMGMLILYSIIYFDLKGNVEYYNDNGACAVINVDDGMIW